MNEVLTQDNKAEQLSGVPTQVVNSPVDIQSIFLAAIAGKADVSVIERIMAMAKEMKTDMAREAYFVALSKFQSMCPVIIKDRAVKNKDGVLRYRFAPLDSIIKQVGTLLEMNGFSYTLDTEQTDNSLTAIVRVHHVAGHTEETKLTVPVGSDYMTAQQMVGAARTFAYRYAFCDALGIMTGDDDTDASNVEKIEDNGTVKTVSESDPSNERPKCPTCGANAIIKGKEEYGGGWLCFKKKGGCGDKFTDDQWEEWINRKIQPTPKMPKTTQVKQTDWFKTADTIAHKLETRIGKNWLQIIGDLGFENIAQVTASDQDKVMRALTSALNGLLEAEKITSKPKEV